MNTNILEKNTCLSGFRQHWLNFQCAFTTTPALTHAIKSKVNILGNGTLLAIVISLRQCVQKNGLRIKIAQRRFT